jgi:sterol desaturase/sphingolipid hydroxylase (fatty acid hydroxylase superfamily)
MLSDYLLSHQGPVYTGSYFAAFSLVALWESISPRRRLTQPMGLRWCANIAITIINIFCTRLFFPLAPVFVALYASEQHFGLFNVLDVPVLVSQVASFAVLDLSNWVFHHLEHRVRLLWRLHAVHHSDPDYDFSTALRFHPLEALLTVVVESLVIVLMGAPAIAVLCYKVVQVFMAAFAHGNLKLAAQADRQLRKVLVTPDLHRIHHSASPRETNSNYGGITPWWDRVFGTYVAQPLMGHENLMMGLEGMQNKESVKLHRMLLQPFTDNQPWLFPVTRLSSNPANSGS